MAGAQRLHAGLDRARAGRLRRARRHPRSLPAGHGHAGAARFLRRRARDHPRLRCRDPAQRRRPARARSGAGGGIPTHHRDHPPLPHRLCRAIRRYHARRSPLRGGERRAALSGHGALAAAVPPEARNAVRLSARHGAGAGAARRRGGARAHQTDRRLLRGAQGGTERGGAAALQTAAAGAALSHRRRMARADEGVEHGADQSVHGTGHQERDRDRRARRAQLRRRTRRAERQCVRGGRVPRDGAAVEGQTRRHRAVERGRARAHEPRARRPQAAQPDVREFVAAGAIAAQAQRGAGGARHRIRLRDRRRRGRQRAGHPRRPAGAAAPRRQEGGALHPGGDQPRARRSGGARGSRHRPLPWTAGDRSSRRAARLPRNPLCRRRQALSAGGERRALVALRRGGIGRRSRPARRQQLAGAQGAHEEPHPGDRRRTDQDRRRAAIARGAQADGADRRL